MSQLLRTRPCLPGPGTIQPHGRCPGSWAPTTDLCPAGPLGLGSRMSRSPFQSFSPASPSDRYEGHSSLEPVCPCIVPCGASPPPVVPGALTSPRPGTGRCRSLSLVRAARGRGGSTPRPSVCSPQPALVETPAWLPTPLSPRTEGRGQTLGPAGGTHARKDGGGFGRPLLPVAREGVASRMAH